MPMVGRGNNNPINFFIGQYLPKISISFYRNRLFWKIFLKTCKLLFKSDFIHITHTDTMYPWIISQRSLQISTSHSNSNHGNSYFSIYDLFFLIRS